MGSKTLWFNDQPENSGKLGNINQKQRISIQIFFPILHKKYRKHFHTKSTRSLTLTHTRITLVFSFQKPIHHSLNRRRRRSIRCSLYLPSNSPNLRLGSLIFFFFVLRWVSLGFQSFELGFNWWGWDLFTKEKKIGSGTNLTIFVIQFDLLVFKSWISDRFIARRA